MKRDRRTNRYFPAEETAQARGNNRKYRKTFFHLSGFTQSMLAQGFTCVWQGHCGARRPGLAHDANGASVGRDCDDRHRCNTLAAWAQHEPPVCHVGVIEIGRRSAAPSVDGLGTERGPQEWRLSDVR